MSNHAVQSQLCDILWLKQAPLNDAFCTARIKMLITVLDLRTRKLVLKVHARDHGRNKNKPKPPADEYQRYQPGDHRYKLRKDTRQSIENIRKKPAEICRTVIQIDRRLIIVSPEIKRQKVF